MEAIYGDVAQEKRTQALENFRNGSVPLLIATDVAARGLDIPNVEVVINYSFPLTVEDYCHRIGRTGGCVRACVDGWVGGCACACMRACVRCSRERCVTLRSVRCCPHPRARARAHTPQRLAGYDATR